MPTKSTWVLELIEMTMPNPTFSPLLENANNKLSVIPPSTKFIFYLFQEYIPIDGLAGFNKSSQNLIFGENSAAVKEGRIVTVQALSGTGSLRVGFEFIKQ